MYAAMSVSDSERIPLHFCGQRLDVYKRQASAFESSVISYGSQTEGYSTSYNLSFESSVI